MIGLRKYLGGPMVAFFNDSPSPPSPSNDTSLQTFTVDGFAVEDEDFYSVVDGTTSVAIVAIPTHPEASVGAITGDSGLVMGNNPLSFSVTAQDNIATHEYNLTIRVLTAGLPEITTLSFSGLTTESFSTNSDGLYFVIYYFDSGGLETRLNFWFNTGNETPPSLPGSIIQITFPGFQDENQLAAIVSATLSGYFSTSTDGNTSTLMSQAVGPLTDASQGTSPIGITITQQGESPS
jgi:hypothetical protein